MKNKSELKGTDGVAVRVTFNWEELF